MLRAQFGLPFVRRIVLLDLAVFFGWGFDLDGIGHFKRASLSVATVSAPPDHKAANIFPIAAPAKTKTAATMPIARSGCRLPCLRNH
jgi:hypothetical protein